MSSQPGDHADLPPHPVLRIEITEDGRVLVDGWQIEVPHGDVRAAAVNAAEDYAANRGHPVRVTVRLPHGQAVNLISAPGDRVTPQPQPTPADQAPAARPLPTPEPAAAVAPARQPAEWSPHASPADAARLHPVGDPPRRYPAANPAPAATMRIAPPAPTAPPPTGNGHANGHSAAAHPVPTAPPAARRDDQARAVYALLKDHPQPPGDVAPGDVPAWPTLAITLHEDGRAQVEGRDVPQVTGFTGREAAVAAAALHVRALGLIRPVRAVATDPDGTQWPLIIHPNGAATGAGEPVVPPKKKRRRRERPG
jgi:hypothetical protein